MQHAILILHGFLEGLFHNRTTFSHLPWGIVTKLRFSAFTAIFSFLIFVKCTGLMPLTRVVVPAPLESGRKANSLTGSEGISWAGLCLGVAGLEK